MPMATRSPTATAGLAHARASRVSATAATNAPTDAPATTSGPRPSTKPSSTQRGFHSFIIGNRIGISGSTATASQGRSERRSPRGARATKAAISAMAPKGKRRMAP